MTSPLRTRHADEQGVAMIFVIVMMLLVTGVVASMAFSGSTRRAEERGKRERVLSEVMLVAASQDLGMRLERWEIGRDHKREAGGTGFAAFGMAGCGGSVCGPYSLRDEASNAVIGEYRVIAPPRSYCTRNCVAGGYLDINPASPERGTVTFFIEARGMAAARSRFERARLVFKRGMLSQYAALSDQRIDVGGWGALTLPLGTAIHSNNVDGDAVGVNLVNVNSDQATRITTRSGTIAGPCRADRCNVTGKTVSFSSTDVAFRQVYTTWNRLGRPCDGSQVCVFDASRLAGAPTNQRMPIFVADFNGASGCLNVSLASYPLRIGSSYPIIDDSTAPTRAGGNIGRYCPPEGGGAVLFEGDVQLEGGIGLGGGNQRGPITIMSKRFASTNTAVTVGSTPNVRVTEPGSIYVVGSGGRTGGRWTAGQLPRPLGLVSQGSVYIPTWSVGSSNRTLDMDLTAVVAGGGGFSMGPTFVLNAAESLTAAGNYTAGGGINACRSDAMTNASLPTGANFNFSGTIASRQRTFFAYESGGCGRGYAGRMMQFDPTLGWYPIPFFPALDPWHLVDWQEYRG